MASEFGKALEQIRKQHRYSQSYVGRAAGFDHSYISRIEDGNRHPTREAIGMIATGLQLSDRETDTLLMAGGFMPADTSRLYSHPELAVLDRALTLSSREHQHEALAAVRAIIRGL